MEPDEAKTRVLEGAEELSPSATEAALVRAAEELRPSAPRRDRPVTRPPERVGRYALLRRLAHGGMATVYLGRVEGAAGFEKVVALKLIHPHLANERDFLEMFLDEARIAARIHHPHVVEILDLGEEDGLHYMAMEWVEGETLSALVRALRPGRLPLAVTLQVIADALAGLTAAHKLSDDDGRSLGLVHRDVSPQNLLISMDGFVKVTDFGIMKAAGRHGSTRTGELRGKVAYMSPEQARGKSLDARSDLFAVGVIAWELLAGRRLFAQPTDAATLQRVMDCEVPALDEEVFAGCDPAAAETIRNWVARALAPQPDGRFESAREMLDAVRSSLQLVSERDPRAHLAAIMKAEFGERVAYVRASLRGMTPAAEPKATVPGILPEASEPSTSSRPSAGASRSLTSGVTEVTGFGSPPRAWAALLLLPLLGAALAVGIAYGLGWGRGEPSAQAEVVPATQPAEIRWFVSTEPEGATLTIDGVRHAEPTPTEILLPMGESPVTLLLEREGMRPTRATLRPLGDDNLFYRLVPASQAEPTKETSAEDGANAGSDAGVGEGAAEATGDGGASAVSEASKSPRIKAKFRPPAGTHRAKGGSGGAPSQGGDGSVDTSASESGGQNSAPGLRPMPDFDEEKGEP